MSNPQPQKEELKMLPCPFCGGGADCLYEPDDEYAYYVICLECASRGAAFGEESRAIKNWNIRVNQTSKI